ncbi:hypothetical protein CAAN1_23S02278 [[Candida] anglica]|uniref:CCHC-type domain-containing protein n=1 Tax=[Candida] anglica TaxID=148631 RepID=A0ABP0ECC9_9ASCO
MSILLDLLNTDTEDSPCPLFMGNSAELGYICAGLRYECPTIPPPASFSLNGRGPLAAKNLEGLSMEYILERTPTKESMKMRQMVQNREFPLELLSEFYLSRWYRHCANHLEFSIPLLKQPLTTRQISKKMMDFHIMLDMGVTIDNKWIEEIVAREAMNKVLLQRRDRIVKAALHYNEAVDISSTYSLDYWREGLEDVINHHLKFQERIAWVNLVPKLFIKATDNGRLQVAFLVPPKLSEKYPYISWVDHIKTFFTDDYFNFTYIPPIKGEPIAVKFIYLAENEKIWKKQLENHWKRNKPTILNYSQPKSLIESNSKAKKTSERVIYAMVALSGTETPRKVMTSSNSTCNILSQLNYCSYCRTTSHLRRDCEDSPCPKCPGNIRHPPSRCPLNATK